MREETHGTLIRLVKEWCVGKGCRWDGVGRGRAKSGLLPLNTVVWKASVIDLISNNILTAEGLDQEAVMKQLDFAFELHRKVLQ